MPIYVQSVCVVSSRMDRMLMGRRIRASCGSAEVRTKRKCEQDDMRGKHRRVVPDRKIPGRCRRMPGRSRAMHFVPRNRNTHLRYSLIPRWSYLRSVHSRSRSATRYHPPPAVLLECGDEVSPAMRITRVAEGRGEATRVRVGEA